MSTNRVVVICCAAIIAICTLAVFAVRSAHCAWCPPIACFNQAACGPGCVCVLPPGEVAGECWGRP